MTNRTIALDPIVVMEHDRFRVVRDDLIPGGTKVRVLLELLEQSDFDDVVYASHPFGHGCVALARACQLVGKRLMLFFPEFTGRPAAYAEAIALPHVHHRVLTHVLTQTGAVAEAEAYAKSIGALFLPVGFDFPDFTTRLVKVVRSIQIPPPKEVWAVAGSGCLVRALGEAWPKAQLNAVMLGFGHAKIGRAREFRAPERPEHPAEIPPPYPSSEYYDAKVWRFAVRWGRPGALIWNVAG